MDQATSQRPLHDLAGEGTADYRRLAQQLNYKTAESLVAEGRAAEWSTS